MVDYTLFEVFVPDKDRVRRNPYYECNRLWDKLDSSVQRSNSKIEFTKQVLCMNLSDL